MYLDSVFRFGIGRYFLGILPTDTEGKLGKDFSVLCLWRERTHQRSQLRPPHRIDKKLCVFSQKDDHDDVFKRGRASCSANMIPIKTPPPKILSTNQFFHSPCRLRAQRLHVTVTEKIVCLLSEMTQDDIFKRGWASCSAIPTRPPLKRLSMNEMLVRAAGF